MTAILQRWYVSGSGKAVNQLVSDNVSSAIDKIKSGYEWVHLDANDPDARQWMVDDSEIDILATDTMMTADSRPRTIAHDDSLLVNLRGVNLNEGSDVTDMVGIRFFVTKHRVVSIERRALKATHHIVERMKNSNAPATTSGFIAIYALLLSELMGPIITELSDKVDDIENQNEDDLGAFDRTLLSSLRRDVISLRRYVAPQRDALNSFTLQGFKWISERDRLHMRSAADQTTRITEELDVLRERCGVIRDHLTDHRADVMNRNMMLLSIVAAIFLPLGLISGMMGINVGGMPWVDNANGFWFVTAIVVLCALIQLIIFKLAKWI